MAPSSSSSAKSIREALWPHQQEALDIASGYLASRRTSRSRAAIPGSALIRMPTGTGKTGVIAFLAQLTPEVQSILIVTPWTALRSQLADDLSARFWQHLGTVPSQLKQVHQVTPSTMPLAINHAKNAPSVVTCTIQTLQAVHRDDPDSYDTMKKAFSAVVVDEGHREPAPQWAFAVRALSLPTILLTATPYRNDHKMFNVDDRYAYAFTHQKALDGRFIRDLRMHETHFPRDPEGFVDAMLAYYDDAFSQSLPSEVSDPRVIVRCETSDEINAIAASLAARGRAVIAVHDRFADDIDDYRRKSIPNPETTDATFWVHQYKLIEGLDDPRFCLLAMYRPLRNARALVQQVGRVIRNPSRAPDQSAILFCHADDRQPAYWTGYKRYEEVFTQDPDKYLPRQIFDTFVGVQPEYQYFEGNFREKFDFFTAPVPVFPHLIFPLITNAFLVRKSFSLSEYVSSLEHEWDALEKDIRRIESPDDNTVLHVYHTYRNSALLAAHFLMEFALGYTISRLRGNHLFVYDTEGATPSYLADNATRIDPDVLQRLFSGARARITAISLMNFDLGEHSIRRRVLQAKSIGGTAPSLADHAHVFTTATGYAAPHEQPPIRRYVGFSRSRVSQPSPLPPDYSTYSHWLDEVDRSLVYGRAGAAPVFRRYAVQSPPPKDTSPVNILFDMDEALGEYQSLLYPPPQEQLFEWDDTCYNIRNGAFVCTVNATQHQCSILFDTKRRNYRLTSPSLERAFARTGHATNVKQENVVSYLNRLQAFRLVTATPGVIYAHGNFYRPRLPLWGSPSTEGVDLLKVFHPDPSLSALSSEKGSRCRPRGVGWERGSLFDAIDHVGTEDGLSPDDKFDLLVCDDMGTEIADFIAASTATPRIAFIHAKVRKARGKTTATAFQEVSAQATKNLAWSHPFSESTIPSLLQWNNPWTLHPVGTVKRRIRRGPRDAEALWSTMYSILRDPASSREIWIVLGGGFSHREFEKERLKPYPRPELVQLFFLLQSTWAAVSSVGATLRVYCPP